MSQFIMQGLEGRLQTERSRIVGLCASLTGNREVAEDLAQEALLEAWRNLERLREPELFNAWLSGIARNICLRWLRKQGQASLNLQSQLQDEEVIDELDLEIELERKELIVLLDRALALLPAETREILVARYIEESSLADLVQRFGIQTSAISMRLQRGKLALQRVLKQELGPEALEYGLTRGEEHGETSAWCTFCGQHHLRGVFQPAEARLFLSCPQCGIFNQSNLADTSEERLFQGVQRIKPAMTRLQRWVHCFYQTHLEQRAAPCLHCGKSVPLLILRSKDEIEWSVFPGSDWRNQRGVYQFCRDCDAHNWTSLEALALSQPEGIQFLRQHPRVRMLPEQEIEIDGIPAIVTRFESVADLAHYEVVSARQTFQALQVSGRNS